MGLPSERTHIPGYRGLILDVSEATGALCQVHEVVDEHGIVRLVEALDLGLSLYEADDALFVPMSPFRLYCEMLDRLEEGDSEEEGETLEDHEAA